MCSDSMSGASILRPQIEGRIDGELARVAHRMGLDVRLHEPARGHRAGRRQVHLEGAAGRLIPDAEHAFERMVGTGDAFRCKQRREDAVAGAVGAGAALPHRELAGPGLIGAQKRDRGERHRLAELRAVETEQPPAGQRARHRTHHRLVPARIVERHVVGEAALNLVGDPQRQNEVAPAGPQGFRHGEDARQVVRGMRRVPGAVGVVEVKVTHHDSVDERGHVRRGRRARSEQSRLVPARRRLCEAARRTHRGRVEGGHRHSHRVDEARLGGVHRGRREMLELEPGGQIDHASYHRVHDVDLL